MDECASINAGREMSWPGTARCLCKFHLARRLKSYLYGSGSVEFCKEGFKLFRQFYWSKSEYEVKENEKKFREYCLANSRFKEKHGQWLEDLVRKKEFYVDYFTKMGFCAGMNSTQRNESLHNASNADIF